MGTIHQPPTFENPSGETSNISLESLLDLLTVLEPEIAALPSPLPLFSHELEVGLAEALGATDG